MIVTVDKRSFNRSPSGPYQVVTEPLTLREQREGLSLALAEALEAESDALGRAHQTSIGRGDFSLKREAASEALGRFDAEHPEVLEAIRGEHIEPAGDE